MDLQAYRFGSFLLDPAKRILLRDDAAITLPPKAFDVIVYLLEQRERAVGRDELIAAVWGKVDITDNALGQVVLQARRALDDSGEGGQRTIITVPRFGYRWAANVTRDAVTDAPETALASVPADQVAAAPEPPAAASADARPSRRRLGWFLLLLALLALSGALGLAIHWRQPAPPGASPAHARASLVVLPAVVEAPPAFGWVRLGVMDLVAHRLRIAGQAIVPSDNVVGLARRYRTPDGGVDTAALLRAAGASALLEVHARLRGTRWQVELRLPARALRGVGEADDVIAAARIATDRLALELGLHPPTDASMPDSLASLLQQVRAAILSEQLDTARSLLQAADDETRALPEIRYHLAEIDFRAGRLDTAARALEALLAQAHADERPDLRPRILNTLANIAYQRGDPDVVADYSERALALLASEDDASETGRALIGRASARQAQHRHDEALADFAQARIALEATGDRLALARVDAYQGLLQVNRDRVAEAVPVLRAAASQLQAFDAVVEELHARVGLVMAELALLEPAQALAHCARLDELAQRVTDPRRKHYAGLVCIDALVANGRLGEASQRLHALRAQAQPPERTLLRQSRVQLHRIAATLAQALGQPATVMAEASAALALPADYDSDDEHARVLLQLARAQRALGRADALASTADEASRWAGRHPEPAVRMHAALAVAERALAQDDLAGIDRALAAALADADASRVPAHLLEAAQAYAQHLLARGDFGRASAVVGRVAAWSERSYDAALLQLRLYHALRQAEPWRKALSQASALAGERAIPVGLRGLPRPLQLGKEIPNDEQTAR